MNKIKDGLGWFLIWLFEVPYLGGFLAITVTLFSAYFLRNEDWLGEVHPN